MANTEPAFGTYRLPPWRQAIRNTMLGLPGGRLGKNLRSVLRRIMLLGWTHPVDIEDFGAARMRLHHADNSADRHILAWGHRYDRVEREAIAARLAQIRTRTDAAVFVDLGSNSGCYALFACAFAARQDLALTVLAIEPDAINRHRLAFNLAANTSLMTIVLEPRAVSDRSEKVRLYDHATNRGGVSARSAEAGAEGAIDAIPLADMLDEHGLVPDILKVDIEGRDLPVLSAYLPAVPAHQRPGLLIAEATGEQRIALTRLLESNGYRIESYTRENVIAVRA